MTSLIFDLRDALRGLRRDGPYAATVVLTLALTIGATTAVFSIVDGVLLQPLAYRESHRLVALREIWRELADRVPALEVNERHFDYWREHATSFDSLAQYLARPANLTGSGDAARIVLVRSSGSLFDVLQVRAAIGRTLEAADEARDKPDVVVLADALWRRRFGSDPGIVGGSIALDGKPYTVVGVLPAGFRLPDDEGPRPKADAFVALRVEVGWVGDHNDQAIGRLRAGVTVEQARAELDVLQAQVGEIATKAAHEPVTLASIVTPLTEMVVGRARRGLLLLLGAIGAVLLIACSNLANLSLTRTVGRLRDAAVRSALGASSRRLAGRALLEQVVLAAMGGALGLWVAWGALALFVRTAPVDLPRVGEVTLDARVLAFAATVSIVAGLLVAVLPAWRIAVRDVQMALRAGGAATTADHGGVRARSVLLATQVALSVMLLVVTGLFGVSFIRVVNVDRGFDADRVLTVEIALPADRYADDRVRLAVYDRLLAAIRGLPGVQTATTTSLLPLSGQGQVNFIVPEGTTPAPSERQSANYRFVAPDFFRTLGIAVRRGRSFTEHERNPDRPLPALVSEPTAARLWPGEDPIGKRFSRGMRTEQGFEVVGIVSDARTTSIERTPPLMVYVPYWWRTYASTSLLIKTAADPASLIPDVRRAVHEIDPDIAIGQARPLEQLVDGSLAGRRYQLQLFTAFGGVALFIAALGVYAVTSYGISRRRREMNIRVALGAQASQVLGLIIRQRTAPIVAGAAVGAAGAMAMGGVVASLLFEVRPRDPLVMTAAVALVASVGVVACLLAARRGLSIDPAAALREE